MNTPIIEPGRQCDSWTDGVRCSRKAEVWLFGPGDTKPIPGGPICRDCAEDCVTEYAEKLGERWSYLEGGTADKCECHSRGMCNSLTHGKNGDSDTSCRKAAVRMVTVPHTLEVGFAPGPYETSQHALQLAMCESCAPYHDKQAKANPQEVEMVTCDNCGELIPPAFACIRCGHTRKGGGAMNARARYERETETIRSIPENYCLAYKRGDRWCAYPDDAATWHVWERIARALLLNGDTDAALVALDAIWLKAGAR